MLGSLTVFAADTIPTVNSSSNFIGTNTAQKFASGVMFYALIFCIVGLVLSAGMWAVGSFSSNYTQSVNGKKGFLICAGAALAIGAATALVKYFVGQGN